MPTAEEKAAKAQEAFNNIGKAIDASHKIQSLILKALLDEASEDTKRKVIQQLNSSKDEKNHFLELYAKEFKELIQ